MYPEVSLPVILDSIHFFINQCKCLPKKFSMMRPDSIWNPRRREKKRKEEKGNELSAAEAEGIQIFPGLGIETWAAAMIEYRKILRS